MTSAPISEIIEILQADRKSRSPRYPIQALPAVLDPKVAEILKRHLASGARLIDIRALPYEAVLGLIPVVFDMEHPGRIALERPSVLILLDGHCQVVSVIDGFDPARPNPNYLPTDRTSAQPFVFLDQSAADTMQFSEADLSPSWTRTSEYIRRVSPNYEFRSRENREGAEDTTCLQTKSFQTALMGTPTLTGGLVVKSVDDTRTLYQEDITSELVVDDSILIEEPLEPNL